MLADYAIGDVQGCYDSLQRLLEDINFDDQSDRLWFVGDLVNRGTQSLAVLRFIKNLPIPARVTLGNHDLHLLARLFGKYKNNHKNDTLQDVLQSSDSIDLGHWLRKQPFLYHDEQLNMVGSHAGIAPIWSLDEAKKYAQELQDLLSGNNYISYLNEMYGNAPNCWSSKLVGMPRYRLMTNYFTRMRFCDENGCLQLSYKGSVEDAPKGHIPWYALPKRKKIDAFLIFGHWAALGTRSVAPNIYPLDSGCVWGGQLTALRLQDRQYFSISCMERSRSIST